MASTAVYGWAIDRFGSARLLPIYLLPLALGFATLAYAPSLPFAALGVMLMGLAGGGQATLPAAAWAEIYGIRHLGAIKALVTALLVAGSAIGPGISGWLIDMGIDLTQQLWGFAAYFIATAALMVVPLARARSAMAPQIDV